MRHASVAMETPTVALAEPSRYGQAGHRGIDQGGQKYVTPHVFRHSVATHLLEDNYGIRTVRELLRHKGVSTTIIYTHVLNRDGRGVQSALDRA